MSVILVPVSRKKNTTKGVIFLKKKKTSSCKEFKAVKSSASGGWLKIMIAKEKSAEQKLYQIV